MLLRLTNCVLVLKKVVGTTISTVNTKLNSIIHTNNQIAFIETTASGNDPKTDTALLLFGISGDYFFKIMANCFHISNFHCHFPSNVVDKFFSQLLRNNSNQLFLCLLVFLSLLFITRWAPSSLINFETFTEKDFKQTVSMHTKTEVCMHLNGFIFVFWN